MLRSFILVTLIFCLFSCSKNTSDASKQSEEIAELKMKIESLKPGLGEIMGTIQQHHAKLYYSGKNQNWELAQFQLDEIKEGLEEATELHDNFKNFGGSLKEMSKVTGKPLNLLETSIHYRDLKSFHSAYEGLTQSCNLCHQATEHSFIVIQAPSAVEFSNQDFRKK